MTRGASAKPPVQGELLQAVLCLINFRLTHLVLGSSSFSIAPQTRKDQVPLLL
jgi:hypothetical protein